MLVIASGSVIVRDNKILLVKHGDVFWKFCGGKVDYVNGESLDSAAKREAKEELGFEINIINSEPFLLYTAKENSDSLVDIILVHYLADFSGEIRPGKDIEQWAWIDLNNLAEEELAPNIIPGLRFDKLEIVTDAKRNQEVRQLSDQADLNSFLHHHMLLVDNQVVVFGTNNWSSGGFFNNDESVMISNIDLLTKPFEQSFLFNYTKNK